MSANNTYISPPSNCKLIAQYNMTQYDYRDQQHDLSQITLSVKLRHCLCWL